MSLVRRFAPFCRGRRVPLTALRALLPLTLVKGLNKPVMPPVSNGFLKHAPRGGKAPLSH